MNCFAKLARRLVLGIPLKGTCQVLVRACPFFYPENMNMSSKIAPQIGPKCMKNRGCVTDAFLDGFGVALGRGLDLVWTWILRPFSFKN